MERFFSLCHRSLINQFPIPQTFAVRVRQQRVDAIAFVGFAPIGEPCSLVHVAIKVLFLNSVMDSVNLPFKQRLKSLDCLRVDALINVNALRVAYHLVGYSAARPR